MFEPESTFSPTLEECLTKKQISSFNFEEMEMNLYDTKEIGYFLVDDTISNYDDYFLEMHSMFHIMRVDYAPLLADLHNLLINKINSNDLIIPYKIFKFIDTLVVYFSYMIENERIKSRVFSNLNSMKNKIGILDVFVTELEKRIKEKKRGPINIPTSYELSDQSVLKSNFPFSLSPLVIANHFIYRHYKQINKMETNEWFEFSSTTDRKVKEERSKHLFEYMINLQNESQFISNSIKDQTSLGFWILVGEIGLRLCDFSLVFVISSSFISKRIKKIEKKLQQHLIDILGEINDITDSSSNFANFNKKQVQYKSSYVIPYLGIDITQWVWMNELLKQEFKADPAKNTNFEMFSKYAASIKKLNKKWGSKIPVKINDDIYNLLDKLISSKGQMF